MVITGGVSPAGRAGRLQSRQSPKPAALSEPGPNFDQVVVSESSFQKQLVGKLSQEVRAATTTGTVAALRGQVRAGEYHVDPQAIARSLLFVWEA